MKHTLLTFDTDTMQGKVRNTLMGPEYGYTHVVGTTEEDLVVSLPINVVAHLTKSPEQALADVKAICQMLEISLKKCAILEVTQALSFSA
ncbi:hypothetical protein F1C16_16855 [Hymenobacter sp. NBH84]|uniref:Uncharacterized protein n=1 Tax=Hymenobacter defluvii TaxID=2054411 RepID=A0ABS3T9C9_9BACT|nr:MULTISPECIES: hypothetical protein [Hymenobacter]MBO3270260.1 hypothetical protein [Hymenobacter defluvii]QNE41116.1 hypothetical protein F1C16_16855 [Hymenobacter sp. NBH84]